ncbi:BTAD domain-containing putative transcriptional regulator [Plantactinospora sp. B5E13]|uniref:AfsR/SARP family transcriptional regulator n=1 Tax=Plantactinospora sp. B5E13 TaxID=3153758 RepID=UPI00325CD7D5
MEFRLLGAVEMCSVDGEVVRLGRRQERLALAILLLEPRRVVATERLVALLWDQAPPPMARTTLQSLMSRIRAALLSAARGEPGNPAQLLARGGGYLLQVDPESVDLHRFRRLVDEARIIRKPDLRAARLAAALDLWRGPALADAASGATRERLCGSLEELRFAAISDRIDAELAAGRHADLIAELSRLTDEHPLRERLHAQLITALHRCGRRADALTAYQRARRLLVAELGLEPGPQLRALEARVIADDPTGGADDDQEPSFPAPVVPAQLPPDLVGFVGRAGYLRQLDALGAGELIGAATGICVITGTAGVGKTSLAVRWARRIRGLFPDGQLYLNLRGADPEGHVVSPGDAITAFLAALAVPPERIPDALDARAALYRSLIADRRILVLLDNAHDAAQVRPLLPSAPGCLAVVTSRNRMSTLVAMEGARPVSVALLTADEAHELLVSRLGAEAVAAEPEAVREIVRLCAGLPLALVVVAARAATNPHFTLAAIARELRTARGGLDAFEGDAPASGVRAVFSWSYQTLHPGAARLFRLLGLHPGPDIALAGAASLGGLPVGQTRSLLATLAAVHLVTELSPGRYTLHDLLRAYASELSPAHDTESDRRAAVRRLLDHYLHTAYGASQLLYRGLDAMDLAPPDPGVTVEDLPDQVAVLDWLTEEHPALFAALNHAAGHGFDRHTWQLAATLTPIFLRNGRWRHMVHRAVLDAADRVTDPAGSGHVHRILAIGLAGLGRTDEAYRHLQQALDLYRQAGDLALQANAYQGMTWVRERQGRYEEALAHAEQAYALHEAAGAGVRLFHAINNLGWCHARLGNYEQALAYCQTALERAIEFGDTHGQGTMYDSLGYIHGCLGDRERAVTYYHRALDRYRAEGSRYLETRTLDHLGDLHAATGDLPAAREAWRQAETILDGIGHLDADNIRAKLNPVSPVSAAGAFRTRPTDD